MSDGVKKVLSIIGLILAILSIVFCWTMVYSIIMAVVALVFAIMTMKFKKGMSIATIVLAIIGIILSVLVGVIFVTALSMLGGLL
jgi:ABC-type sugar transport system permease subunit